MLSWRVRSGRYRSRFWHDTDGCPGWRNSHS